MMKLRKVISILMITILMFSMMGIFNSETKAATYLINEADLYSKGELLNCFTYKGIPIGVQFVVYKKNGVEYPAYCLNRNLIGVTEEEGAKVTVDKVVGNAAVWRAVTNGYPYKTPSELKCNSNMEAFAATKMAVYDALYTYNWSDFKTLNDSGKRIIAAAESISKKARSSKETKTIGTVEVSKVTEDWTADKIEKEYISRTYKVTTNVESTKYTIKINGIKVNNFKLTDLNNKEKTEFAGGEQFKVLIPISELENKLDINTEFDITATANLKTKPVLYGETSDSKYQDYALAGGDWEFETDSISGMYPSNKTKIKIVKQDTETNIPLQGAKFTISDENKNILYTDVTTGKDGIAEISGILPGKYYIEEAKSPEGYTKYDEIIEIEVAFNEIYTVKVNNYQKPKEEEKQVEEEKEMTVVGEKEIALPKTGF